MVTIDVRHDGLGRFARVSAPGKALAEKRAADLARRWNQQFERRKAAGDSLAALKTLEAEERSEDAERAGKALAAILIDVVRNPPVPDWSSLYDTAEFGEQPPVEPAVPVEDREPQPAEFEPARPSFLTRINPWAMRRHRDAAIARFKSAHDGWDYVRRARAGEYDKAMTLFRMVDSEWQTRRSAFLDLQARSNARVDALREGCSRGEAQSVISHCDLTLLSLDRPEGFPCFWTMTFVQGVLQMDYELPSMDQVPVVKAVKYNAARDTYETVVHSERERERLYAEAVFQSCLAVLHALFTADATGAVKSIAFNGWTNYIDRAAAHPGRACILSLSVDRTSFSVIDLAAVDPIACFRSLNGTMSPKLAAIAAQQ